MKALFTVLALISGLTTTAQEEKDLSRFHTIVSGPHIELHLTEGVSEHIKLDTRGVSIDKVICEVKGNTLHVYLKNARNIEKTNRYRNNGSRWTEGIYKDSKVIAHITYRQLKKLVTKGEESVDIKGTVGGNSFKYKSFGDQKVTFANVETDALRVKMYGSSDIQVKKGYANLQRYKLYGEHNIDTKNMKSEKVRAANFGEMDLEVDTDLVCLTSFGEAEIASHSPAKIRKGIVLGRTRIK